MGYFGTNDPIPELIPLRAGALTCFYERGNLRYIKAREEELIRLIYTAIRDDSWNTIPYTISDEHIKKSKDSFQITYTAHFEHKHISYRADFELTGTESGIISFQFKGTSLSDFRRNRIGICVLHPIESTIGQKVTIKSQDDTVQHGTFPELVSPHQPFLEITEMQWQTRQGGEANLKFDGEIFETEDQRNWTDHSFKTYGTPLRLPMPVEIRAGDTLYQKVSLTLKKTPGENLTSIASEQVLFESDLTAPFPKIGFGMSRLPLNDQLVETLRAVPMCHLRVLLEMETKDWENRLKQALKQASQFQTRLELVVKLADHPWQEVVDLIGALTGKADTIASLSLINEPEEVPELGFLTVGEVLKKYLPSLTIGYATDGFFADLNRNRPKTEQYDFVAFSLNPQVHAVDFRTIIENVSAQPYPIQTIRSFSKKPWGIHVSPLSFRVRTSENSYDARLHTEFGAAFTLLSLRYLAGVDQVTLYETHGPEGLLPEDTTSFNGDTPPLYRYLKKIKEFDPDRIGLTQSPDPWQWDALLLLNKAGEKLYFLINFSSKSQSVQLGNNAETITIPAQSILIFQ